MSAGGSLLVVTGPPGAGKSTVSHRLAHRAQRSMLVEGDAFFGFVAAGAHDHSSCTCVERVRTRAHHEFDDEAATRDLHAQFAAAAIDARHVLDTTDLSIEETVEAVLAARASGRLRHPGP